jgi:hypothetical protein
MVHLHETASHEPSKPACKLVGTDGNVFAIIAAVRLALWDAGQDGRADEFSARAFNANSYDEVLGLATEYVEVE